MKVKVMVLVNLYGNLGGAEIRYLNLFNEIVHRKNDYYLIINRKLYEIATAYGYLKSNKEKVIILEIDNYSNVENENKKESNRKNRNRIFKPMFKLLNRLLTIKNYIYFLSELNKIFKRIRPDYVYAIWVGGMLVWPLKYIYKFKFVYSYMDSGFSSLETFWKNALKSELFPLKNADIIDFLSYDLFEEIDSRVNINNKVIRSVSPCSFKNYDGIKPNKKKENTVVFCARMTKIKNPFLLLESIKIFNESYNDWIDIKFQFLGDGECLPKMKEFVEANKLENIFLLGHVNYPVEYLCKSKIFISIQQTNNYPSQSLLEAMACENAIIASDVGETRLLVTENEGLLISLDKHGLAKTIQKLIQENDLIEYLGGNGRKKVLAEHNVDRYLDYFYSLEV